MRQSGRQGHWCNPLSIFGLLGVESLGKLFKGQYDEGLDNNTRLLGAYALVRYLDANNVVIVDE